MISKYGVYTESLFQSSSLTIKINQTTENHTNYTKPECII